MATKCDFIDEKKCIASINQIHMSAHPEQSHSNYKAVVGTTIFLRAA
jgi:hypothetical protein